MPCRCWDATSAEVGRRQLAGALPVLASGGARRAVVLVLLGKRFGEPELEPRVVREALQLRREDRFGQRRLLRREECGTVALADRIGPRILRVAGAVVLRLVVGALVGGDAAGHVARVLRERRVDQRLRRRTIGQLRARGLRGGDVPHARRGDAAQRRRARRRQRERRGGLVRAERYLRLHQRVFV